MNAVMLRLCGRLRQSVDPSAAWPSGLRWLAWHQRAARSLLGFHTRIRCIRSYGLIAVLPHCFRMLPAYRHAPYLTQPAPPDVFGGRLWSQHDLIRQPGVDRSESATCLSGPPASRDHVRCPRSAVPVAQASGLVEVRMPAWSEPAHLHRDCGRLNAVRPRRCRGLAAHARSCLSLQD